MILVKFLDTFMLLNMKKRGFQCDYLQKSWEKCVGKDDGKREDTRKRGERETLNSRLIGVKKK